MDDELFIQQDQRTVRHVTPETDPFSSLTNSQRLLFHHTPARRAHSAPLPVVLDMRRGCLPEVSDSPLDSPLYTHLTHDGEEGGDVGKGGEWVRKGR